MKRIFLASCFAFVLMGSTNVAAQDASQNQSNQKKSDVTAAVIPLRVQVLFTEYDGDKKISSLPYTFSVNADDRRTRPNSQVRSGVRIPLTYEKDKVTYIDVGTNIDCSAMQQDDGKFKLTMTIERNSVSSQANSDSSAPVIRQFRAEVNPVLKDGQTVESIVSTDPLSGHVFRVNVTLAILK